MNKLWIELGAGALGVLLVLLAWVWWQAYVARRISYWIGGTLSAFALEPQDLTEVRVRRQMSRVIGIGEDFIRIRREQGGARIIMVICGPGAMMVGRRMRRITRMIRFVREAMPPWCSFGVTASPETPPVGMEPPSSQGAPVPAGAPSAMSGRPR